MLYPNKNFIFSCSHCSCTIFVLISYPLYTQVILILIFIDVNYSQKADFSFEKGLNGHNHSSSGSNHLVKKSTPSKISDYPPHLNAIWKTLGLMVSKSDCRSSGPWSFPKRREYEFAFEFVNLLLKIKGGKNRRPNFVIFVVHTMHGVTRKRSTKRLKHTRNLFRKNLHLVSVNSRLKAI